MDRLFKLGPFVFASAIFSLGLQQLLGIVWGSGPVPGPPLDAARPFWACLLGIGLLGCALSLAWQTQPHRAAIVLATLLLGRALIVYVPGIFVHPHKPYGWTSGFELLAMAGACLTLLTIVLAPRWKNPALGAAAKAGRIVFAAALVVFGVQHFLYANFIATLIPAWIPGKLFWAIFVGAAFVAAAAAIVAQRVSQLATFLLGTMFFLWVLILHLPRVAGALRNGNEWTSALVALTMGGASWIIGWAQSKCAEEHTAL